MLPSKSRVYTEAGRGIWSEDATKCGESVRKALVDIAKEFEDKFSPDEFENIVISELVTLITRIRIGDFLNEE